MMQKWYVLNISGSLADQRHREKIYLAAAKKLGFPLVVEHNAAPCDAKDTAGEPFYGPAETTPDEWWSLVWSSTSGMPSNLTPFWDAVVQLSHESNAHARSQSLVSG